MAYWLYSDGCRGAKELVAEIFPKERTYRDVADEKDVKRGKKYYKAAEHILNAPVAGSTTLALDFSDLSKPFGGGGMEGTEMGWDGSRHCKSYGHDFISVSIVGPGFADAVPVYVRIARGRRCSASPFSRHRPTGTAGRSSGRSRP